MAYCARHLPRVVGERILQILIDSQSKSRASNKTHGCKGIVSNLARDPPKTGTKILFYAIIETL